MDHGLLLSQQLFLDCMNGYTERVRKLLADPHINVNYESCSCETPFFIACLFGHTRLVKLLLNDERVKINSANICNGMTPLSIACEYEFIEIVKYILASGKEVNLAAKDNNGKTVIDIAKEEKRFHDYETEEEYEERKKIGTTIVELLESFERNQNETRLKLRVQLGLAGKYFLFF